MIATALALALLLAPAGGSDSPTPYAVDAAGITLPAGHTFADGGHVNIRTTSGARSIHFESLNNQPSGEWIGSSFLPWSAFGLDAATVCVEWVQITDFNEHFGEGGQAPVGAACAPATTPSASPTPTQTPVPSASPTAPPTPSTTPTRDPQPATEGTGPTTVPIPETYNTPAPTITALPTPTRLAATGGDPTPGLALAGLFLAAGLTALGIRRAVR